VERKLKGVIAKRQLRETGPQRKIISIVLGRPRKVAEEEWVCQFQITGVGASRIHGALGLDGLQALLNAIEGLRAVLEKTGRRFSWTGGEEGDSGLPRFVPTLFGVQFTERINRIIDREIERFSESAERRYKTRRRRCK
jgi:hypothetical protein